MLSRFICVQFCVISWTVTRQAPLSTGFSRQEYWSGLPFPSAGDLPYPGIKPRSPASQADPLTSEPPRKPKMAIVSLYQSIVTLNINVSNPLIERHKSGWLNSKKQKTQLYAVSKRPCSFRNTQTQKWRQRKRYSIQMETERKKK